MSDVEQAVGLASLCCKSAEAAERFLAFCEQQAHDLLFPHGDVLIVLSTVLRIRRTLDGAEIDKIIREFEAHKALAAEHRRRADRRKSELAASRFQPECHHADASAVPWSAPVRVVQ